MATRAEQFRTETERANSARRRALHERTPNQSKSERLRAGIEQSKKQRAIHGRTKLQADAKALTPDHPGKTPHSRPNGGEEQTLNGVSTGRGADGPPGRPSRKSSRGTVPAGEKPSNMTRAVIRTLFTPERRAQRRT